MAAYFICLALLPLPGRAMAASGAGTTAANFLKIPVAVIPAGLGEAYTSMVGPDSVMYNPAGLGLMSYSAFSGTHNQYLLGINQEYAALVWHTRYGTFGGAYTSLASGDVDGYDSNDMPIGHVKASQSMAALSYSKSWPSFPQDAGQLDPMLINPSWTKIAPVTSYRPRSYRVSLGATAKRITENYAGESASVAAFDAGMIVLLPRHLHLGLSAQNIGPAQKFYAESYRLPSVLRAGFAKDFHTVNDVMIFTFTTDMVKYRDTKSYGVVGAEVDVSRMFQLRMGYRTSVDVGSRLCGGLGLNFDRLSDKDSLVKGLRADYAFVGYGDLGSTQRIGIQIIW